MKQARGDAVGAPGPYRLNREITSRYDRAPVAPVYGQRCGVSDSLSLKAEQQWRITRQEHFTSTATLRKGLRCRLPRRAFAKNRPEWAEPSR